MKDTSEVFQAELHELQPSRRPGRTILGILSFALAGCLLVYVFPRILGTTASDVSAAFKALSRREAEVLVVLWFGGLVTHSFVLTAALPGLSQRRGLTLNLTGSAVANVLPLGGAAGMSLNYLMIRVWGMDAAAFASFTVVTNVWVILLKLVMPMVALIGLAATGGTINHTIRWTAIGSSIALALLIAALVAALANRQAAARAVRLIAPLIIGIRRLFRRGTDVEAIAAGVLATRDNVAAVVADRWIRLTVAMLSYGLLQALLLWGCLEAVGGALSPVDVLAAFAVDRVLSMIPITPGGAGFAEAGTAAVLVALGGAPAAVAAGVLLYRGFSFALEIPVGGIWLAGWLYRNRDILRAHRQVDRQPEAVPTPVAAPAPPDALPAVVPAETEVT